MCQVDDGELVMRKDLRVRKTESRDVCVKCASEDVVIPHGGHAALCRPCFLGNVTHKFRAAVAKSQALRQDSRVILAYSGGIASGAMLTLVADGVKAETTKKLRFHPGGIIHVEESAAAPTAATLLDDDAAAAASTSLEKMIREKIEFLQRETRTIFGVDDPSSTLNLPPFYVAPLECVMEIGKNNKRRESTKEKESTFDDLDDVCVNINHKRGVDDFIDLMNKRQTLESRRQLTSFLGNVRSTTSKIRAATLLRTKLLSRLARTLGHSHLMEGVSAPRVAIEIMTDLALGRGTQIPRDVGLVDDRFQCEDGVTILRPLREFSSKEIAVFNNLHKVSSLAIENVETKSSPQSSIQRATEEFILGLQTNFSSTISTVCKTGEKLVGKQPQRKEQHGQQDDCTKESDLERCCFCNTLMDVPEAPLGDVNLLRQVTAAARNLPGGTATHILATAARALDVSTAISRAPSDFQNLSSSSPCCNADGAGSADPRLELLVYRALCLSCRVISQEIMEKRKSNSITPSLQSDLSTTSEGCLENLLPSFLIQDAISRENRKLMRMKIQDFLLEDT